MRSGSVDFDVVIPARYASTRLPGKPLVEIGGKPLIQWVFECAQRSGAARVMVATDDSRIKATVDGFGGEAHLTRADHASGADRIAELVETLRLPDDRIVVNVQGDEPRMPASVIDQTARLLSDGGPAPVSTVCHRIRSSEEFADPNVVKVVFDSTGRALYFSRAPIPWRRDGGGNGVLGWRHIGIYGYRAGFLRQFTSWQATALERSERLEQLRILENGVSIRLCEASETPGPGIDTPDDLLDFKKWVAHNG